MSSPKKEKRHSLKGLKTGEKQLFRGMETRAIMAFVKESWVELSSQLKLEAMAV